ncbi:3-hydroxy-9,10-secoandrosta-1,3,5(10)-triene-9,17-dione monooxygenase reductase subunit [Saccharopolyspora griseoalba]|uniref:3-hydroxy-9,10-secoandrosta-1,3,5(10)-triene-9, 17-dione monooxygenase reductase subunit n=1 Tax=Saccharopolyspora griseoalba TaxID=1431848 RepID=A0ABW2LQ83_9PSEU
MDQVVAAQDIDSRTFRRTLGHFCTGVTVVTGTDGQRPVGFACQSFAALSLDPPLVLFCPGRWSRTWPLIERSGVFGVNVLTAAQRDVSSVFGRSGEDKFAGLSWRRGPAGAPILDGVLTWLECAVESVHDGGDHDVVIGRVHALGPTAEAPPLLFHQGAYTTVAPDPSPAPADFLTWDADDWL